MLGLEVNLKQRYRHISPAGGPLWMAKAWTSSSAISVLEIALGGQSLNGLVPIHLSECLHKPYA